MTTGKQFLEHAYETDSSLSIHELYEDWAKSYDRELRENGYATPARVATAMAANVSALGDPMLDIGCGTGLSGEALKSAGFIRLDGTDFSGEMLAMAEQKAVYGRLLKGDVHKPLPVKAGDYVNASAIGVLNRGHAIPDAIETVLGLLPSGGCFGFSLNDTALEDGGYEDKIRQLVDAGVARVVFEEYGDHLPGIDLRAKVYVLRSQQG